MRTAVLRHIRAQTWSHWRTSTAHLNVSLRSYANSFQRPLLLREYIHESLYNPEQGYFTKQKPPVGRLPEPISFRKLVNQADYLLLLDRLYKQLQVDWLTPSEIFRPWWGQGVAKYILETRQHVWGLHDQLQIVEVGGGTGSLAASILDHIAATEPVLYAHMSYVCIEVSPSLAQLQQQTVVQECRHTNGVFTSIVADATSPAAWQQAAAAAEARAAAAAGRLAAIASDSIPGSSSSSSNGGDDVRIQEQPQPRQQQQHCFVLMMEVLDNLPHDRAARAAPGASWQQTLAAPTPPQQLPDPHSQQQLAWQQQMEPLTDPLIQRCLAAAAPPGGAWGAVDAAGPGQQQTQQGGWLKRLVSNAIGDGAPCEVYLPTTCLQLLEQLHACRPKHTLLAADFDALPDVQLSGLNAPLVSGRSAPGQPKDYGTLFVPWGSADIFFPTDFDMLGRLYLAAAARATQQGDSSSTLTATTHGSSSSISRAGGRGARSSALQQRSQAGTWCDHVSTSEFMTSFVGSKATRTLGGFNPLLQDWGNARFFEGHAGLA